MSSSGFEKLPPKRRMLFVSVRELVEFVLRTGDLAGDREFSGPSRALEGTRGHQQVQRTRAGEYKAEVSVSHQFEKPGFVLQLRGRIDGVIDSPERVLIEEIKTVRGSRTGLPDPLHWAQAKIYAFLYSLKRPTDTFDIRLTYVELNSNQLTEHTQTFTFAAIEAFFLQVSDVYLEWITDQVRWWALRDESIDVLKFPYAPFRPGQEALMAETRRTHEAGETLLVEAPTGIGKTLSVLYPSIEAVRDGNLEKIFYLTAKTVGKHAAENGLRDLRKHGLRMRSISLTARDKMCFNDGKPCDVRTCSYAKGYFDRVREALRILLEEQAITGSAIERVALDCHVCPHSLALDASLWADVVICDYNYFFDPNVQLKRFFSDGGNFGLLVDEAHNLVDRARDMFSAELTRSGLEELREVLGSEIPICTKFLHELMKRLRALARRAVARPEDSERRSVVMKEIPDDLLFIVRSIAKALEEWLALSQPSLFRDAIVTGYFQLLAFSRIAELYDSSYLTIVEPVAKDVRLRLFCLDPSTRIQTMLKCCKSAVFFSGTLSPIEYFEKTLCGTGGGRVLRLNSPFPPENFNVIVADRIATTLRRREATYATVAKSISALVRAQCGNYLVFFPSYKYLTQVLEHFRMLSPDLQAEAQVPRMSEQEREAFIGMFRSDRQAPLVGFAVMGGIFGEAIDLIGDRLVGAVVVGVGLPQIALERELIREYYEELGDSGFDYAYTFPGMNRVLQAAGRVIRSETDRGVLLLIDSRFAQGRYRTLFPGWWNSITASNEAGIQSRAKGFWDADSIA